MSADLSKIRRQLNDVKTMVRQERILPAVQYVSEALNIVRRASLIKNERSELEELLKNAVAWIADSKLVREKFPLSINYTPGKEEALSEVVQQLLEILHDEVSEQANESIRLKEERRKKLLAESARLLEQGQTEKAADVHRQLSREFFGDYEILAEIGEQYLSHALYEEAYEYLAKALDANPEAIPLYNRVGIALRKLERYEAAEKYYRKALEIAGADVGLLFNLGRLYVEWRHWGKAEKVANMVVKIAPDMNEGNKLLAYVLKQRQLHKEELERNADR
ncbi:MAG: tetratricopeptide repeat protein [Desulfovibrionaceae bacterium]|nr:tetratricopeptide repeat protein [Desulfovibrionaceae bacterium]